MKNLETKEDLIGVKTKEKKSSASRSCTSADEVTGCIKNLGCGSMKEEPDTTLNFFQSSLLGKRKHSFSKTSDDEFTRQQIKLPTRIVAQMNAKA